MNTAEIIYEKSKNLPESYAQEVLDFIGYLQEKRLKESPFQKTDIEQGFGCANYHGKTKSLQEMEQAIANEIKLQWNKA